MLVGTGVTENVLVIDRVLDAPELSSLSELEERDIMAVLKVVGVVYALQAHVQGLSSWH